MIEVVGAALVLAPFSEGCMELWDRFFRMCLAANAGLPNGGLASAATAQAITAMEQALGLSFPDDLRTAYLHFNGSGPDIGPAAAFPGGYRWIGIGTPPSSGAMYASWKHFKAMRSERAEQDPSYLEELEAYYVEANEDGATAYQDCLHPKRVLVGSDATDAGLWIDLDPPKGGVPGQLIYADLQDGSCIVLANSFSAAAEKLVAAYEGGTMVFEPGRGWVHTSSKLPVSMLDLQRSLR